MKRKFRVRKHQEFDSIIRQGHFVKSHHFVVYYHRKDEAVTRIGISVSKKNGNAVTRNKIKRQVRATIATAYSLNKPLDIIIIVRASYDPK
jgi:ribonuclease P protein component